MPDGESLVRQILVGKRYFQKNFGADITIGWNPDSFGYNWQLPQIYKKSGIDYFVTSKLLWATDYTKFPYRLFWWEAPDGSRLLTYFPHEYANDFNPEQMTKDLSLYAPLIYGTKVTDSPRRPWPPGSCRKTPARGFRKRMSWGLRCRFRRAPVPRSDFVDRRGW